MSASVEVGGDIEEAVDEEVARAEAEGMVGVPLPVPGEHEEELRQLEEMGKHDHQAEKVSNLAWAMDRIIEVNQQVIEQKAVVKEAQAVVKDEKETLESLQDELNRLITDAAKAKQANEPDPARFPLFDKAKEAINAQFPAPEAIQPLPPDTFAEFYRRKAEGVDVGGLGLKPQVVKILRAAGLKTMGAIGRYTSEGKDLATVKTDDGAITDKRREEILDAMEVRAAAWQEEWAVEHPPVEFAPEDE